MNIIHDINEALNGHGHGCTCDACSREYQDVSHKGLDMTLVWRLAVAAVLLIAGIATLSLPWVSTLLCLLSVVAAGYDVFIRAVANIVRERRFGEALLMCVASVVAIIIDKAVEGAAVILLFVLGELLTGYAVTKGRNHIEKLMDGRSEEVRSALENVCARQGEKSRSEESVTHFTQIYTPVVLVIAVLIAVISPLVLHTTVTEGVYRALVLLVIACPCAIAISVPLAYFAGIAGAADHGVLVRNTASIDELTRLSAVVFDKSGALMGDGYRVVSVKSDRMDADVLLRIAAHACAYSEGAYAESIKTAYQGTIYIELIQSFQQEPGKGITVEVDGVSIILGTETFLREHGIEPGEDATPELSAYLAIDGKYAGRILFVNTARPGGLAAVKAMSWDKDCQLAMLSEDSPSATEKFARSVGIGQYYADCNPETKAERVKDIRERQRRSGALMFVGKASTDAASLHEADIGTALGAGTDDSAVLEADVAVLEDSPTGIISAIDAAKHTKNIVRQNLLFTLGFKIVVLALDMLGVCPLWLAVLADVGIALVAIVNALRAFSYKETFTLEKE